MAERESQIIGLGQRLLLEADRKICGENQLPATFYERISGDQTEAEQLARGRVTVAAGTAIEIAGTGLATFGLSKEVPPSVFALGTVLNVLGGMIKMNAMNENGTKWTLMLRHKLDLLGVHGAAVEAALIDAGISDEEVRGLYSLPRDVYNSELTSFNSQRARNTLRPISSGIAMAGYGDYVTAGVVTMLGLSSFPVGEYFYKQADKFRAAQSRAGQTAKHIPYQRKVLGDHIGMTNKINFVGHTPEILFAVKYLFDTGGNVLAAFNGLQQGLEGLSGTLSFQRSRESSRRTVEIATNLIKTISDRPFIATPQRWNEHVSENGACILSNIPIKDGLVVTGFKAFLPSGERTSLAPLNLTVSCGESVVLRAESGTGKSVTLMALMHLLEHEGGLHIVQNSQAVDVHTMAGPSELSDKIALITEEGINGTERVADLFRKPFQESHIELFNEHTNNYDQMLVEVAWQMTDNLLEAEIKKIQEGEKGVFPHNMLRSLQEIRDTRSIWVNEILDKQGGNIATKSVRAQRVFSTLSAGERRRLLVAVAEATVDVGGKVAIILDEPLAHLDVKNRKLQLERLRLMQERNEPVALILVSHENVEELQTGLNHCQIVNLEKIENSTLSEPKAPNMI